jgi:hypothetical protein
MKLCVMRFSPAFCYFMYAPWPGLCSDWLRAGWPGYDSQQGKEFSLLHSIQPGSSAHPASYPVGSGDSFLLGYSGRGMKLTAHLHLVPRSRMVKLYFHSSTNHHGLVLNYLSTGTTLPLPCSQTLMVHPVM